MRGTRGTLLLVVLAFLTVGVAGYALERSPATTAYNGPQARPFTVDHEVWPQVAFIGDSYTSGSDQGGVGSAGWPGLLAGKHQWFPTVAASGGSGYIIGGPNNQPFSKQLPKALPVKPALLVIWASRNDVPRGAAAIEVAANQLADQVRSQLPSTRVVVIGPAWINSDVPADFYAVRNAERRVATAHGCAFIDPLTEGWFSGDKASLIGSDHVHPTNEGHRYLADLIDADLTRLGATQLPKPSQS